MPKYFFKKGDRGRTEVEARDDSDALIGRISSKFADESHFIKATKTLDVSRENFVRMLDEFDSGAASEFELDPNCVVIRFAVRGLLESTETAEQFNSTDPILTLKKLCDDPPADREDPIVTWDDRCALCCVDLDATDWTDDKVEKWLVDFQPAPSLSWVTKSGGLRLVYRRDGRFTAEEIAAIAYLHLSTTQIYQTLELKGDTRLPKGRVFLRSQTEDYSSLRRWLKQYSHDDNAVQEWLESRGLKIGDRLEHDRCPISPSTTAKGTPVIIGEAGIKCFVCEAHGVARGGKPGFFSYYTLVGGSSASVLWHCLQNKCHWEHAKYLLEEKFGLKGEPAKLCYRAALKMHHPPLDDLSVDRVMLAGQNLLRMDSRWTTLNGEAYGKDLKHILAELPAACDFNPDKKTYKPSLRKVAMLEQTFDLVESGYPHLSPIFGLRMYSHFVKRSDSEKIPIVVQTPNLSREDMEPYRPKYVVESSRLKFPWAPVEEACPGIDKRLVKLMIVAKGYAEGGVGMPPMVFISGPTSSAKSSTVVVAAAMAGDGSSEHVWTSNIDRVRQAVKDLKDIGSFAIFNEFLKEADRAKQGAVQAADFILNLTPNSTSWKIWTGPVKLGDLPVFVWTDTRVPTDIKKDAQLARRLIHVHLPVQVDWRTSLHTTGMEKPDRIRVHSRYHAQCCDAILSEVMDEFFRVPTTFEDAARKLGYKSMAESAEAAESVDLLAQFFEAVCDAPGDNCWKTIQRNQDTPLLQIWEQLADEDWRESRRCSEVDWQKVAKLKYPARFEVKSLGQLKLCVRFRSVDGEFSNKELKHEATSDGGIDAANGK